MEIPCSSSTKRRENSILYIGNRGSIGLTRIMFKWVEWSWPNIMATHGFNDGHHWLCNGCYMYGAMPLFAMPCICQSEYEKQTSYIQGWGQFLFFNSISIAIPIPLLRISFNSNSISGDSNSIYNYNSGDFKSNLNSRNDLLKSSVKLIIIMIIMITRYM